MARFRKKPVVIEAEQFLGNGNCIEVFHGMKFVLDKDGKLTIPTLEGDMTANVGDWIIKGVKGEIYPCKPDIFEATYDPIVKECKA